MSKRLLSLQIKVVTTHARRAVLRRFFVWRSRKTSRQPTAFMPIKPRSTSAT